MGLLRWLLSLFGGRAGDRDESRPSPKQPWARAKLAAANSPRATAVHRAAPVSPRPAYRFARQSVGGRGFYDLSQDVDRDKLDRSGLPVLATPDDLAEFLGLPLGKVAWLTNRFVAGHRPPSVRAAHYVVHWKEKRGATGRPRRLIESPKPMLAEVQRRLLREILDRVPAHPAAHGFVVGRSIVTNARPHVGKGVILKLDLENFYATVRYGRVVAIFRSLGFSREVALWLAALTTSSLSTERPPGLWGVSEWEVRPYLFRHLPQGAPTSPALANLSAYSLDVRLAGLAAAFGGTYTRYADDLTISGDDGFGKKLRNVIPLAERIIGQERFRVQKAKRKVLRRGRRLTVTGVVVNEKPNVRRDEFDRLKAILHNAIRHGAASQNREAHPDFAAHLRGRIAHVAMLNPDRGAKLASLYDRVEFR